MTGVNRRGDEVRGAEAQTRSEQEPGRLEEAAESETAQVSVVSVRLVRRAYRCVRPVVDQKKNFRKLVFHGRMLWVPGIAEITRRWVPPACR